MDVSHLAKFIDHTLLKPETTEENVRELCVEAKKYGFYSVCISPWLLPIAVKNTQGSSVKPITVVGFPSGCHSLETKLFETRWALDQGAQEIDMVINLGAVRSQNFSLISQEIETLVSLCQNKSIPVKVILESAALTLEEKVKVCALAKKAKASFVKTSTGFHPKGGATPEDVALMVKAVHPDLQVKASGGIRTTADALKYIELGATRLGTSASVEIIEGFNKTAKEIINKGDAY